jgi:hypothetical protein
MSQEWLMLAEIKILLIPSIGTIHRSTHKIR